MAKDRGHETEQDTIVRDIIEKYNARPLPPDYWRREREREAHIRARLLDAEARILGRRLSRTDAPQ